MAKVINYTKHVSHTVVLVNASCLLWHVCQAVTEEEYRGRKRAAMLSSSSLR